MGHSITSFSPFRVCSIMNIFRAIIFPPLHNGGTRGLAHTQKARRMHPKAHAMMMMIMMMNIGALHMNSSRAPTPPPPQSLPFGNENLLLDEAILFFVALRRSVLKFSLSFSPYWRPGRWADNTFGKHKTPSVRHGNGWVCSVLPRCRTGCKLCSVRTNDR